MNLTAAIRQLEELKKKHGDVAVQADCPYCGKTFDCDFVVIAPQTARLKQIDR